MENSGNAVQQESDAKAGGLARFKTVMAKINSVINIIGVVLFRLRKLVLAAPVVYYALKLAAQNMEKLPQTVGLNLQSTGEYAATISRELAVMGPLGLTAGCLLMMFCSRKALYPWAISVFTLVLPLLLLLSNVYPS